MKLHTRWLVGAFALASLLSTTNASAQTLVAPSSATATNEIGGQYGVAQTINGNGLTGTGLGATHALVTNSGYENRFWISNAGAPLGTTLTYNYASAPTLSGVAIWNAIFTLPMQGHYQFDGAPSLFDLVVVHAAGTRTYTNVPLGTAQSNTTGQRFDFCENLAGVTQIRFIIRADTRPLGGSDPNLYLSEFRGMQEAVPSCINPLDPTALLTPTILAPVAGGTVQTDDPVIAGTTAANALVEVFVDGMSIGTVMADAQGAWTILASNLGNGVHNVRARATQGMISRDSALQTFTVALCGNGAVDMGETCDDGNATAGDGCSAVCATEAGYACTNVGVDRLLPVDTLLNCSTGGSVNPIIAPLPAASYRLAYASGVAQFGNPNRFNSGVRVDILNGVVTTNVAGLGSTERANVAAVVPDVQTQTATFVVPAATTQFIYYSDSACLDNSRVTTWRVSSLSTCRDNVNPTITITAPVNNARTNDTTPTISGTAADNLGLAAMNPVTVTVRNAAMMVVFTGSPAVNGAGVWTIDTSALPQGVYTVTATATDAAGNSATAGPNTFTIDTTPPSVTLVTPVNNARTNDTTPTVSGTAEIGSTVVVTIRNAAMAVVFTGPAPVNGAGAWTVDSSALGQGTYTVTATATDAAGNNATAGPNTFTIDTAPPAVAITAPANNSATNDTTPTVSGTAEVGSTVVVTIRNAAMAVVFTGPAPVTGAGTWTVDSTVLLPGTYTVSATATDAAGNSASAGPNSFTVDLTPPAVAITQPTNGAALSDTTPTIAGTTEAGATVVVTIRNAAMAVVFTGPAPVSAAGTWTVDSSVLTSGAYTVTAAATDAAGNSATAGPVAFTIDNTPPAVAITAPANNAVTNDTTPTISGTAEIGATVVVTIRNAAMAVVFTGPAPVSAAGTWSVDSSALPEGSYTVSATATDAAGNAATAGPRSFSIDALPPAVSLVSPANGSATNDSTPTIAGAGEPGATVEVFIDNVSVGTVVIPAGGMWSLTPMVALLDGAHTVRVTATDAAGNSATAGPNSFLVDTQAPITLITSPADGTVTSNVRPGLSGTSEPGASVDLELRDAMGTIIFTQTVTADAMTGAWSATLGSDLVSGSYTLTAEATDAAGNAGQPAASSFTVDTTVYPLDILTPVDGAAISDTTPTISGLTAPGVTVSIQLLDAQGAVIQTLSAVADAMGNFSVDAAALADGAYTVQAQVTTLAGLVSNDTVGFTVDTAAPMVTLDTPVDGAALNVAQPVISGTSEAGAEIEVTLLDAAGMVIETLTATADMLGAWSVTPTMPLADGSYSATATASDRAGNSSSAGPNTFSIDTLAPALSITSPVDGSIVSVRDVVVSGATDAGQEVLVELLDDMGAALGTQIVVADAMGAYSATFQNVADGAYTATASATDAAGNTSDAMTSFSVSSEQPTLTVTSPADGAFTNTGAVVVSGTTDADATVAITVTDAGGNEVFSGPATVNMDGTFSLTIDPALMDGAYTVTVTATGPNGLSTSEERDVVVDATAPVTVISQPGAGAVVGSATPTITGTSEPNSTVTISIDGMVVGTATTDANGMWSLMVTTPLAEGAHTISASSTDAAGNAGQPATVDFTVDLSAPMVTITAPMAGGQVGSPVVVTGTAEPGAQVTILIDGMVAGTATADASGAWSFEAGELSNGMHTVEATSTDAGGNAGSSGVVNFEVKTSAPVAIITPVNGGMVTGPSITVTGTGEPGSTVTVTVGGQTKTVVVGEDGSWTITFEDVPAGSTTIEATDGSSTSTVTFTVNDPSDDSGFIVTGGGCAQGAGGGAGSPLWLAALGLLAMRRRRRA